MFARVSSCAEKTLQIRRKIPKIHKMIERHIQHLLLDALAHFPAVALLGPRQVGKTTLAKSLDLAAATLYLDLESPEDLAKLRDPLSYLEKHIDKLVILDEIQRVPDLFMVLRGLIDKNRQSGRKHGQYLLLGSASMDLMRQSSESLAGRICYLPMSGLTVLEACKTVQDIDKIWLRGGFPESFLAPTDRAAMRWLEMLIRTYIERDIPQLGFNVPASRLRILWTMIAHGQGEPLNLTKLAGNLDVEAKTIKRYLAILADLLLITRLEPWHENLKKRLVKAPRYYIRDTGLLHQLLMIDQHDTLIANPILGKSWEGFVIENIRTVLPDHIKTYYYRTTSGAEIDLVLILPGQQRWAIEVKYGRSPKVRKGFFTACADIQAHKRFIVYGGQDEFPIENDTTMLSLTAMLTMLKQTLSLGM